MNRVALAVLFAGLLAAGTVTMGQAASAPVQQNPRERNPYPILDQDARLAKRLTIDRPNDTLGEVLQKVAKETGVDLVAQGEMLVKPIVVTMKQRAARDILADIGVAMKSTWVKRGQTLVLVEPTMKGFFGIGSPTTTRRDLPRYQRQLVQTLTPQQRYGLQQTRELQWTQLTPQQRKLFRQILALEYYLHPDRYPDEILTGKQAVIRWVDGTDGPTIMLCAPRYAPDRSVRVSGFAMFSANRPGG